MKIGLIQYSPEWEDKEKNKKKLDFLLSANSKEISLLIFPEMTLTGFTMQASKFAEPLESKSFEYFSGIAKSFKAHVLAGIIEVEGNNFYNTLIHISPEGKLINSYRKIHPFSHSEENIHYKRGERTLVTIINDWNVGLSICYDLRFPELFRQYGKAKTELIITIANWPVTRIEHWRTLLKARAIENQCYIAGVNRIGNDPKLEYNGFSSIFDPMGNEIISAENVEEIITADISIDIVTDVRNKLPFLDDIYLL